MWNADRRALRGVDPIAGSPKALRRCITLFQSNELVAVPPESAQRPVPTAPVLLDISAIARSR
jgi:hypothetical protein